MKVKSVNGLIERSHAIYPKNRERNLCLYLKRGERKKREMTVRKVRKERERRRRKKKDWVAFRDRTWSKENGSRVWRRHNVED